MGDVLLVLADAGLHDDLARCSAAAGYTMVVGDTARCRHQWLRATAVAADGQALDALTGIVYTDDSLVVALHVYKHYADADHPVGGRILIDSLERP